ncbi:semaphorin-4G-like isoform X2 [Narcine bancroftii]|uniref:semaphorin-4G-like isoform X2 n=1 Tax=Narcine bancroftii TaxID=1343680 RepID=UPI003831B7E9
MMPKPSGCGGGVHLFMGLLLGVTLFPVMPTVEFDNIPRRTTWIEDLLDYKQFNHSTYNYTTFWLEEEQGVLYVGARGAIFALNVNDISDNSMKMIQWKVLPEKRLDCLSKRGYEVDCYNYIRFLKRYNGTHFYTCGTYAFNPHCAYIEIENFTLSTILEEKERCPYDPTVGYTGLIVDNKIYTATRYGFHGGQADIKSNFKERTLRMDDSVTYSLNDPNFVDSVLVTESVNSSVGDDDKIYLFFTEKLGEESAFNGKPLISRVARICKSDEGGMRTLQRKWTSFLKTRIVCSIPEYDFHLNILKSIYMWSQESWQDTIFYGVFVSQWKNVQISAVCQYNIMDIRKAFEGPYKESQDSPCRWSKYMDRIPEPRPGSCITDEFRKAGIRTSRDLPDDVLDFVKKHLLMNQEVRPVGGRPLFTKKHVNYTKIVVDMVTALDDRQYPVMFIGTANGWIHKVVITGASAHAIEEIQVFKDPEPVESLVLAREQGMLFVGSRSRVIQLPLSSCQSYSSCWDCVLARDPYCLWDGLVCRTIQMEKKRGKLIQGIMERNKGCFDNKVNDMSKSVQVGSDIFLQCQLSSNTAIVRWEVNGTEIPSSGGPHYWQEGHWLVVREATAADRGTYTCRAQENGVSYSVSSYDISMMDGSITYFHQHRVSKGQEFVYLIIIVVLGTISIVLAALSIYLFCSPSSRGRYEVGGLGASQLELQNVSSACVGKEGEAGHYGAERFLKIIPGEGATTATQRATDDQLPPPPPPPPPPIPLPPNLAGGTTANGLPGLPHVLRKMNGNSYVLLRQASDMATTSPHYHSFTEELSKMLEKRKHAQLVEKLDESSV